jgi:hypothetical protein
MCNKRPCQTQTIRAAARIFAQDHERHPTLFCLMRRFGYCFDGSLTFIEECRSEMRRLGRTPLPAEGEYGVEGPFRS